MSRKLRVGTQAQVEIGNIIEYYERQRAGLGSKFMVEIESVFRRILTLPYSFPVYAPSVHRAILDRFPYRVFFRVTSEFIEVLAVQHQKQAFRSLKNRIRQFEEE